ncbi:hypothetical protein AJ88_47390 [Mesorhizobium amorphae CCBAU 01583]|nr:hypothetical protein AJ88_47390 [Mesorhizobium amorphae CCBAU 01583]
MADMSAGRLVAKLLAQGREGRDHPDAFLDARRGRNSSRSAILPKVSSTGSVVTMTWRGWNVSPSSRSAGLFSRKLTTFWPPLQTQASTPASTENGHPVSFSARLMGCRRTSSADGK